MLHEDMMSRFQPEWVLGQASHPSTAVDGVTTSREPGRLAMTAAVLGNALAGGLFLGGLVLLPLILSRLLTLS